MADDLKATESATSQSTKETCFNLQQIVAARESARRTGNNLLKPLSEIELAQFSKQDHVSTSYYKLPYDFPVPVCSGRFGDSHNVLNDLYCSITTGSENFKFKQKYEYEDNLFKNEDAMYSVDHQIL